MAAALILTALPGCGNPVPETPPPPGSWLVLLCRAADAPAEPQPPAFYQELFARGQADMLFNYFDLTSNSTLDVSGSRVQGWFPMQVNTADIGPTVRNNGMPVTRTQTARDCRFAALAALAARGTIVDPANYAGVITVINVPIDVGAAGDRSVVINAQHAQVEVGFIAHEMMHILGLPDSWRATQDTSADHVWRGGAGGIYGDCWDMMSFRSCVYLFQSPRGAHGPELQGVFRERLGWLPTNRIQTIGAYPPRSTSVTLAPLSDPSQSGPLLVKVEVAGKGHYSVEYRERGRFDRGIPSPAVVIREVTPSGPTHLVHRQNGRIDWIAGEMFTDPGNFISIAVNTIASGAAAITVNTAYSTSAGARNEWCGEKSRGQVRACAAGLQCDARRTGSLVSIDWYCQ